MDRNVAEGGQFRQSSKKAATRVTTTILEMFDIKHLPSLGAMLFYFENSDSRNTKPNADYM
jgi:hypothetical protein